MFQGLGMAGRVPALHVFATRKKGVDARVKPGHDKFRDLALERLAYAAGGAMSGRRSWA